MGHREQAQFDRARWRLVLLVPIWMVLVALLLCLMAIFAYRLAETIENYEEEDKKGELPVMLVVYVASIPRSPSSAADCR